MLYTLSLISNSIRCTNYMLQQLDGFHILIILTNIKRQHKDNVSMHALHAWPKPVTSTSLCTKTGKNPQQEISMWSQEPRVGKRCLGLLQCRQYIPLSFCKCHKNLLLGGTCHEACKEAATCWVSGMLGKWRIQTWSNGILTKHLADRKEPAERRQRHQQHQKLSDQHCLPWNLQDTSMKPHHEKALR